MALTVKGIEALEGAAKRYRKIDGGGLALTVQPSGAKAWEWRSRVGGETRVRGLGAFPDVSLARARALATEARQGMREGRDVIAERRAAIAAEAEAKAAAAKAETDAKANTFKAVAARAIAKEAEGLDARTVADWKASLDQWAYPVIGDKPIAEIGKADVLRVLTQPGRRGGTFWNDSQARAKKVYRRMNAILRYAQAHDLRAVGGYEIKVLKAMELPRQDRVERNHPALVWGRVPAFMKALAANKSASSLALQFSILTALRSNAARQIRYGWLELRGDVATLTIPGEIMKGRGQPDHRVPLSDEALDVLAAAAGTTREGLRDVVEQRPADQVVFASTKGGALSDMALSQIIRGMNEAGANWRAPDGRGVVPHGFRTSFSVWVDDNRPGDREAAERALAHEIGGVSGAYRDGSDQFATRIGLMAAWGAHCFKLVKAAAPAEATQAAA